MSIEDNCLLWGIRVILPEKLRERVIKELHNTHPGIVRKKAVARSYFWWPQIDKDIERKAKSCTTCASNPTTAALHPWIWPSRPWERVHVDFAGPFQNRNFFFS